MCGRKPPVADMAAVRAGEQGALATAVAACAGRWFGMADSHIAFRHHASHVAREAGSPKAGLLAAAMDLRELLAQSPDGRQALRDLGFESGKCQEGAIHEALRAARLALVSHNNCLITDRPDLPRSAESGWTTAFTRELALIDTAIGLSTASRCWHESSGQQREPSEGPATPEAELHSSRSHGEARS